VAGAWRVGCGRRGRWSDAPCGASQSTPLALEAAEFLADTDESDRAFWAYADAWRGALPSQR